ncbi:hypothetical protein Bbelb_234620 [Branchiostoma belcheri]|nr:hypothetical protein Bbelb_234620 [Branchiostoma belcheri]
MESYLDTIFVMRRLRLWQSRVNHGLWQGIPVADHSNTESLPSLMILSFIPPVQVVPWDDNININGQTSNNAGGQVRRCLSLTENMTYTAPPTLPGETFVRHSGPLPTLTETTTDVDLGHAVRKVIVVSSTASL